MSPSLLLCSMRQRELQHLDLSSFISRIDALDAP